MSNRNPLHFIERNLILASVVELCRPRRLMVGDVLRDFELAAVLQVRGDAAGPEGVVPDPGLDAGDRDVFVEEPFQIAVTSAHRPSHTALHQTILHFRAHFACLMN